MSDDQKGLLSQFYQMLVGAPVLTRGGGICRVRDTMILSANFDPLFSHFVPSLTMVLSANSWPFWGTHPLSFLFIKISTQH